MRNPYIEQKREKEKEKNADNLYYNVVNMAKGKVNFSLSSSVCKNFIYICGKTNT